MAQYNITIDSEILHYLFLKGVKDEGMTKLLESVLNQVLQAQAAEQIKAEPYERTEEREDYRNGYYKRRLETRVGNIVLQIPRFRYGKFTTDLFQRYQRSEQALLLALMEMASKLKCQKSERQQGIRKNTHAAQGLPYGTGDRSY